MLLWQSESTQFPEPSQRPPEHGVSGGAFEWLQLPEEQVSVVQASPSSQSEFWEHEAQCPGFPSTHIGVGSEQSLFPEGYWLTH